MSVRVTSQAKMPPSNSANTAANSPVNREFASGSNSIAFDEGPNNASVQ